MELDGRGEGGAIKVGVVVNREFHQPTLFIVIFDDTVTEHEGP